MTRSEEIVLIAVLLVFLAAVALHDRIGERARRTDNSVLGISYFLIAALALAAPFLISMIADAVQQANQRPAPPVYRSP